ncbi:unnamed protein product [Auanema sp. JU1783]|nr:unnamed protein product [Auanema sp. JU1783]
MANLPDGILLGMGNPLLDIQAVVTKEFLEKWNLKENDAILCDDKHVEMFEELARDFKVEYIPGGATQNSIRICQWILNAPNKTTFFGAIGQDNYGDQLKSKAVEAGVNVQYQINPTVKTGTCAALITGTNRSLCAHLAAANTFTIDHLNIDDHHQLIEKAQYYYIAGFFLTVCPPAIMQVAKHSHEHNKVFMFNLAAPFISQFFTEPLLAALPYVDIIFGNEAEAEAFAKAAGFDTTDLKEIALKIAAMEKVSSKKRTVIITQGSDPTIVAVGDQLLEFPVELLSPEKIVDTNGAGDAFVGGFLSQYVQGKGIEPSIAAGHYAASEVIQKQGCSVPETCKYH